VKRRLAAALVLALFAAVLDDCDTGAIAIDIV